MKSRLRHFWLFAKSRCIFLLGLSLISLLVPVELRAQDSLQLDTPDGVPDLITTPASGPVVQSDKQKSLVTIERSIEQLSEQLKLKQLNLRSPESSGRREELTIEIQDLARQIRGLQKNFREIAAGVDIDILATDGGAGKISWSDEVNELLGPVLTELKEVTSRPREISRLQSEIRAHEERLEVVLQGIANIDELTSQVADERVRRGLQITRKEWEQEEQRLNTQLAIRKQKLDQRLGEKKSLTESIEQVFHVFFKTRGRNLLLALLATILFWLIFRKFHRTIRGFNAFQRKQQALSIRLFNVGYIIFTLLGAALVFLLVLYFFADWVLLILAVALLFGIAWASKQAIPIFGKHLSLLLNLGSVRENERVIYAGLPWMVKSVNFYCLLENPNLSGGYVRLPIADMADLRSRPFMTDEIWFPTRLGDWVVLGDGVIGKTITQTIESVRLEEHGGAIRTYATPTFVGLSPRVLSQGFRIPVTFGIDYQHQAKVTDEIPTLLERGLVSGLLARGYEASDFKITVEFQEAAASALNLSILADFSGSLASQFQVLGRLLQRLCVDLCNQNFWIIPFQQITLHLPDKPVDGINQPKP